MYVNARSNVNKLEALWVYFMLCTAAKECMKETFQIYTYVVKTNTIKHQDLKCLQ